jgi:NTE family protein
MATGATVGLVLGAGGVVGYAWHCGVLAAVERETGWDARTAAVVVGTSAGASVAATLRAGLSAADHLARVTGEPLSPAGRLLAARAAGRPGADLPTRPAFGVRRPASPTLLARALLRPGVALAGAMPAGTAPTAAIGDRIRAVHDRRWPEEPTWICAVRLSDGRRVVFGRDAVDVPDIGTAVEASSAIPGWFAPVAVAGQRYVDGGAHSPTNADVVGGLGLDLVVVSSPMSAVGATFGPRAWHARTLAREVRGLRAAGTPVLVLQPTADDAATLGVNAMDPSRQADAARLAARSAASRLARPDAAALVDLLG